MKTPRSEGEVLFSGTRTLDAPYRLGDDPRPLQVAFAALFDEAAQVIYLAGSDLDEVLVERILVVRTPDITHEIQAEFLADAELLKKSVLDHFPSQSNSGIQTGLEVPAVKIVVRRDEMTPT